MRFLSEQNIQLQSWVYYDTILKEEKKKLFPGDQDCVFQNASIGKKQGVHCWCFKASIISVFIYTFIKGTQKRKKSGN